MALFETREKAIMAEAKGRLPRCCKLLFSTQVECVHQVVHLGSVPLLVTVGFNSNVL